MRVTNIFSFSKNVFYPIKDINRYVSYIKLSSANVFNLIEWKIVFFSKALKETLYHLLKEVEVLQVPQWHPHYHWLPAVIFHVGPARLMHMVLVGYVT